jgi:hypothetical protein
MKKLPLLLLACIAASAQAAVYQWQDDRGKTQYGDTPPPGVTAEPVDLPPISTVPGQPAAGAAPAATEATAGDATTGQPYTRIAISSPGNGQTIRTDTGRVDITVNLQPALQEAAGHRLVAVVDGVRIQGSAAGVAILAPRGSHRAQVVVLRPWHAAARSRSTFARTSGCLSHANSRRSRASSRPIEPDQTTTRSRQTACPKCSGE